MSPFKGCVHVYDIEGNQVFKLEGRYRYAHLHDNVLVVLKETKIPIENK